MVGQFVPVTGIGMAVPLGVGVAPEPENEMEVGVGVAVDKAATVGLVVGLSVEVAVGVALGVAVVAKNDRFGVAVAVAVGLGDEQRVRSVVHDAPSDEQQYLIDPQVAIDPTFAIVEQLISCGASPAVTVEQLRRRVASPATGQASAAGQTSAEAAFSLKFCCCLTK